MYKEKERKCSVCGRERRESRSQLWVFFLTLSLSLLYRVLTFSLYLSAFRDTKLGNFYWRVINNNDTQKEAERRSEVRREDEDTTHTTTHNSRFLSLLPSLISIWRCLLNARFLWRRSRRIWLIFTLVFLIGLDFCDHSQIRFSIFGLNKDSAVFR